MSADTIIGLMDTWCSLRRNPCHSRQLAWQLTRAIRHSLKIDHICHAKQAESLTEQYLEGHGQEQDVQGAFDILKRWYRHASARLFEVKNEQWT